MAQWEDFNEFYDGEGSTAELYLRAIASPQTGNRAAKGERHDSRSNHENSGLLKSIASKIDFKAPRSDPDANWLLFHNHY